MDSLMPETQGGEYFLGPQCTVCPMVCLFCALLITVNQKDNFQQLDCFLAVH